MRCAACEKRIGRGRRCLILALGDRGRLGVAPVGEELICCSRACGARVLVGEVFSGDVGDVPAGTLWPAFPKRSR